MHSLAYSYSLVPAPFAKEYSSLLNFHDTVGNKQLTIRLKVYFWNLHSIPLIIHVCHYDNSTQYHFSFVISSKIWNCNCKNLCSLSKSFFLFLTNIVLAVLNFHTNISQLDNFCKRKLGLWWRLRQVYRSI